LIPSGVGYADLNCKTPCWVKLAHGQHATYPAQVNPPPEPQLLLEALVPFRALLKAATLEIFLVVSRLSQLGHVGLWLASEKRLICSNSSSQLLQ
jgi:hypothetical protein